MLIEAITNIKYKGKYRMPGTPFDCEDKIANDIIKRGIATAAVDPAMLEVAQKKNDELSAEIQKLKAQLSADIQANKKIRDQIKDLKDEAKTVKDKDKKKEIKKEVQNLSNSLKDTDELKNILDQKGQELKITS